MDFPGVMSAEDEAEIAAIKAEFPPHQQAAFQDIYAGVRRRNSKKNRPRAVVDWRIAREKALILFSAKPPVSAVVVEALSDTEIYAKLDRAARGKTASDFENIQWAKNLLKIPLKEIDPDSVPSPVAVVILEWGRNNLDKFAEMLIPRAVAPKNEEAKDGRRTDVDKALLDTIAEVARIGFESPSIVSAEGLSQECGVPAAVGEAGQQ